MILCLAASYANQTQQTRAEQPNSCRNWNNCATDGDRSVVEQCSTTAGANTEVTSDQDSTCKNSASRCSSTQYRDLSPSVNRVSAVDGGTERYSDLVTASIEPLDVCSSNTVTAEWVFARSSSISGEVNDVAWVNSEFLEYTRNTEGLQHLSTVSSAYAEYEVLNCESSTELAPTSTSTTSTVDFCATDNWIFEATVSEQVRLSTERNHRQDSTCSHFISERHVI